MSQRHSLKCRLNTHCKDFFDKQDFKTRNIFLDRPVELEISTFYETNNYGLQNYNIGVNKYSAPSNLSITTNLTFKFYTECL